MVAGELVVEMARGAVVVVLGPSIAVVEPVLVNQMVCVKPDSDSGASASGLSDCVKPDSGSEALSATVTLLALDSQVRGFSCSIFWFLVRRREKKKKGGIEGKKKTEILTESNPIL